MIIGSVSARGEIRLVFISLIVARSASKLFWAATNISLFMVVASESETDHGPSSLRIKPAEVELLSRTLLHKDESKRGAVRRYEILLGIFEYRNNLPVTASISYHVRELEVDESRTTS